jgi:hypothetical protein
VHGVRVRACVCVCMVCVCMVCACVCVCVCVCVAGKEVNSHQLASPVSEEFLRGSCSASTD